MFEENNCGISSLPPVNKPKPYEQLINRLVAALRKIDDKTRVFQVDHPKVLETSEGKMVEGEFEIELRKTCELAESINNKLPF